MLPIIQVVQLGMIQVVNAHNATINGPTFNSNFGGYFDFDGTNDD